MGNGPTIPLEKYINGKFEEFAKQLKEIAADVKMLRESRAILEGQAKEIDKKASQAQFTVAMLISSAGFLVAVIALFIKARG